MVLYARAGGGGAARCRAARRAADAAARGEVVGMADGGSVEEQMRSCDGFIPPF